jgi:hypothetical protein
MVSRPILGEVGKLEVAPGFEADEEDALAVLRHHLLRVNDLVIDSVAEFPVSVRATTGTRCAGPWYQ